MARPLRIEFPGAVYHVTSRGNRREPIFVDDADRAALLQTVGDAAERFGASLLAYCLMDNHYHFVLRTHQPNLSRLMRQINGVYTQAFNRRHGKAGHVFQGRFKAIVVDSDAYLLAVCRYVELNPVRARLSDDAAAWRWSSCRAHLGLAEAPAWLDSTTLFAQLLGRPAASLHDRQRARQHYAEGLAAGRDDSLWPQALRQQIYLGDEAFVARLQAGAAEPSARPGDGDIPREQTRPPLTLPQWLATGPTREVALRRAHIEGGWTLTAIARELGLSVSRVSRLVARAGRHGGGG
jgi:REP element-mobilizing transposase RayT